jgi:hypothetical protein
MKPRLFNYFVVHTDQGGKLIAVRIIRSPLGYGWLDHVKQQYFTGDGWDVREDQAKNYGTDRLARAAMRMLAEVERST